MAASRPAGRWVIVLGDTSAPVFWSNERESLDVVCAQVRQTCPTARVVWQEMAEERDPMRRRGFGPIRPDDVEGSS